MIYNFSNLHSIIYILYIHFLQTYSSGNTAVFDIYHTTLTFVCVAPEKDLSDKA